MRARLLAAALAGGLLLALSATAAPAQAEPTVWLCRPGATPNPCLSDRTATAITATGATRTLRYPARPRPRIDCFYVYPTVSNQPTINADLTIDPAQTRVAKMQASRFSQRCRVFAPMYRQLTLKAISGAATGSAGNAGEIAYGGVRDAFRDYLRRDNRGRGFVLIGHSQGSFMLRQLVRNEIDGVPSVRRRLISALLIGAPVTVKRGRDVGGDFQHVPACRRATQLACVVSYSSFDSPPPADALFGRVRSGFGAVADPSLAVLCVNPAALGGGTGRLSSFFATPTGLDPLPPGRPPWVTYPGLYRGHCMNAGGATWLQIDHTHPPGDPRPLVTPVLGPTWGLHIVDVNLALGNLVDLVARQAAGYARRR